MTLVHPPSNRYPRLVVLISGSGSNLQALIDAQRSGLLPAEIAAVISNKADAYGLTRAAAASINALVIPKRKEVEREAYDAELAQVVLGFEPDLIILAGWMRLLSMHFLRHFPNRVINLHPALPGAFPGVNSIERAFQAYQAGTIKHTGIMVHYVPDEGMDVGPVIATTIVPIEADDTLDSLEARVHEYEHRLLVETVCQLIKKHE